MNFEIFNRLFEFKYAKDEDPYWFIRNESETWKIYFGLFEVFHEENQLLAKQLVIFKFSLIWGKIR